MKLKQVRFYQAIELKRKMEHSYDVTRKGFETLQLSYEDGLVNLKLDDEEVLVPVTNVVNMIPFAAAPKIASKKVASPSL